MLVGNDIFLRPLELSDSQIMVDSSEDEEIRYMTNTQHAFTRDVIERHIKRIQEDDTRVDFAICLNDSKEMIGELSISDIDEDNQSAGFRIALSSKQVLGKGYGTQACQLAIDYAFDTLKLNRLQLEVYSHNPRGIKAYEKAGFIKEGILREAILTQHGFSDEIIMAVIRSDREGV